MKSVLWKLLLLAGWVLSAFVLSMQLAYFLSFDYDLIRYKEHFRITLDPSILLWQGNSQYLKLTMTIIGLGSVLLLLRVFMPGHKGKSSRKQRRLTKDEKLQYSHLAGRHEAKKRLLRIRFDRTGHIIHQEYHPMQIRLGQMCIVIIVVSTVWDIVYLITHVVDVIHSSFQSCMDWKPFLQSVCLSGMCCVAWVILSKGHLRDYADVVFNGVKKVYNDLLYFFHVPDIHKLNTIKTWKIGERNTTIRSGLPVITGRNCMWVDPSDSHNLIIGTTNSGKTFSIIHEMIECTRMTGESMVINDLKGELYHAHQASLHEDGYRIICINFIEPDKGDLWNPFDLVIRTYRQAQREAEQSADQTLLLEYREIKKELYQVCGEVQKLLKEYVMETSRLEQKKKMELIREKTEKKEVLKRKLQVSSEQLPKPDFSQSFEYLRDVADAIFPSAGDSKGSNSSFWNQNGERLLEGIVCFLLEHEYIDQTGNLTGLKDTQINFKSFQMAVNDGFTRVITDLSGIQKPLLRMYLDDMRLPTDQSVIKLRTIVDAPEETSGSITNVFSTYMDLGILNEKISRMTSVSSFQFEDLWNQKVAVFLITHDEKATFYPLNVIFLSQLFAQVAQEARKESTQRLKYPVNVIWDEFGISPPIRNLNNALSASRSKGVRFTLVIQDFSQLSIQYSKDFSEMIKNNTMNVVYLLGGNPQTQEEMSKRIGNKLQWNKEKGTYETVPVITKERLSRLSIGEAVVVSQRKNPYLTRYLPYNRYIFFDSVQQSPKIKVMKLPSVEAFSLMNQFMDLQNGQTQVSATEKNDEPSASLSGTMMDFSKLFM